MITGDRRLRVPLWLIVAVGTTIIASSLIALAFLIAALRPLFAPESPIVDRWELHAQHGEVEWREGLGIPLEGTLVCDGGVAADEPLQFTLSLVLFDSSTRARSSVPVQPGPAVLASNVCGDGTPILFEVPWAAFPDSLNPDLPVPALIRYSVTADGHETAVAESPPFVLTPSEES